MALKILYSVKDYGAVGDGVTDDTVAIQATNQACFDGGGGIVWFPVPTVEYLVSGALQTSVNSTNPNCQIYIPFQDNTTAKLVHIEWVGEGAMNKIQDAKTGGVIIRSTILGSGTAPRVLGGVGAGTAGFSYTGFSARNIRIRVRSKTGASHIAPTMTAWGMKNQYNFWGEDLIADTESTEALSVAPTAETKGFEMPSVNNTTNVGGTLIRCKAQGFAKGYEPSDHSNFDAIEAVACLQGVSVQTAAQPILIKRYVALNCKYPVGFEGSAPITIQQMAIEDITSGGGVGSWNVVTADFFAAAPVTCYGSITFSKGSTAAIVSGTFGNMMKFINIREGLGRQVMMGGAQAFVTGGVGDWNGTIDKPVFVMKCTDLIINSTQYADFTQDINNAASTTEAMGRWAVKNTQISSANKYLGYIYMYTKGAIDIGEYQMYIAAGSGTVSLISDFSAAYHRLYRPFVADNDISPTQIAADQNNYAPTNIATAATIRASTDATRNLTGIAGGAGMIDGRELTILNIGSFNLTGTAEDAASTAANRFAVAWTLLPGNGLRLVYDGTSARWRKLT